MIFTGWAFFWGVRIWVVYPIIITSHSLSRLFALSLYLVGLAAWGGLPLSVVGSTNCWVVGQGGGVEALFPFLRLE
jgi:hypothetical protein